MSTRNPNFTDERDRQLNPDVPFPTRWDRGHDHEKATEPRKRKPRPLRPCEVRARRPHRQGARKAVIVNGHRFPSINAAAKATGLGYATLWQAVERGEEYCGGRRIETASDTE